MKEKHYMNLSFGLSRDGSPLIYNFLWDYLPKALKSLGYKTVSLEMERLEPLDRLYSNIDMPNREIKKVFDRFCKAHGLRKGKSLTSTSEKTSIKSKVSVKDLSRVVQDYNLLFDVFFTDLTINADHCLKLDMMDAASDSVLAIGSKECVDKFAKAVKKQNKNVKAEYAEKEK